MFFENLLRTVGLFEITVAQASMILVSFILVYLGIVKKYEPLLLIPISFGMMIANIPIAGLSAYDEGGLLYYLYQGIRLGIYPPMIFLCLGAMTDFSPLIANPKYWLIGLGVCRTLSKYTNMLKYDYECKISEYRPRNADVVSRGHEGMAARQSSGTFYN